MVETLEGEPAGIGDIHDLNPQAGTFHLALRIFRPFWRRGYAREALMDHDALWVPRVALSESELGHD